MSSHRIKLSGMRIRHNFELRLLWPILLLGVALWAFLKIAGEVLDGDVHTIDRLILQACRINGQPGQLVGPIWFQEGVRDITALGSPMVLTLTVLTVWGYLLVTRQHAMAWLAVLASSGGWAVSIGLKALFSRARPEAVYHATVASGYSFPSGHAMMSAAVFLTLAALAARLTPRTWLRVYAVGAAGLMAGLVGLSRVYLGVHWASDVAAGWAAGAAWALLCWLLADRLALGRDSSR